MIVSTGALTERPAHGKLNAWFTRSRARGRGAGTGLPRRIHGHARGLGPACPRLETGAALATAARLCAGEDLERRGIFGACLPNVTGILMEKRLP